MSIFHVRVASVAHPCLVDVTLEGVSGNTSEFVDAYMRRNVKGGGGATSSMEPGVCVSEVFGAHTLYHMCLGGAQFVCLSSSSAGGSGASGFQTLPAIKSFFLSLRRLLDKAAPPLTHEQLLRQPLIVRKDSAANVDLERQVRLLMRTYNTQQSSSELASPSQKKMQVIRDQVADLSTSMSQNIELVMQRDTKIEVLVDSSAVLAEHAVTFEQRAHRLRRIECRRKWKLVVGCACVLVVGAWACIGAACGTINLAKC